MASTPEQAYRQHRRNTQDAARVLDEMKVLGGCVDCGFNLWPEALHFDHREPGTKLKSLGWVDDRSKLKSKAKLARFIEHVLTYCEIRCANCHAHRTKVERHWQWRGKAQSDEAEAALF